MLRPRTSVVLLFTLGACARDAESVAPTPSIHDVSETPVDARSASDGTEAGAVEADANQDGGDSPDPGADAASLDLATGDGAGPAPETACNGHDALCARPFDQVCFPMTHNSMSNGDAGWLLPNQTHGITRQLADGVRGLMLDVHPLDGQATLCHGLCDLGNQPLVEGLGEIAAFLIAHPREVVSIIFEPYVAPSDIAAAMDAAGLTARLYVHAGGAWPTLESMIHADTRLVVFAEADGSDPAWYHRAWDLISDTNYSAKVSAELTCDLNRGAETHDLFLINNWLGNPFPDPAFATEVNARAFLLGRAQTCAAERGHVPNFLGVDFYEVGDVVGVARVVNGLEEP